MKQFPLNKYIFTSLRRIWGWWPPRRNVRAKAQVGKDEFKCASCSALVGKREGHIDHVSPVIDPLTGFTTWDNYIERLFCDESNLEFLCKECHSKKTKGENKIRRANVRAKKSKRGNRMGKNADRGSKG